MVSHHYASKSKSNGLINREINSLNPMELKPQIIMALSKTLLHIKVGPFFGHSPAFAGAAIL